MRRYSELIDVLTREKECSAALLAQSLKKKEALVQNDPAALEAITATEAELVRLMTGLEQERLAQTRRIADDISDARELTISDMIELAHDDDASQLQTIRDELTAVLAQLSRENEINTSLIETQLIYFGYMINAATTPSAINNNYTASGSAPDTDERLKLFDHQI